MLIICSLITCWERSISKNNYVSSNTLLISEFWDKKHNYKAHDEEVTKILNQKGWNVIRIWECELKKKNRDNLTEKLRLLLI